jgi:nucleoside-specific outer membrane channel protein Tsx
MRKTTLAALALAALAIAPLRAADWSDTFLGWQYSDRFRDPGLVGTEVKHRLELGGTSGWAYGVNMFDVSMLTASRVDPANDTTGQPTAGIPGDNEVYVLYRSSFDLGRITRTSLAFGPVREVDLTVGFDFDSTDNKYATNKRFYMAGPQLGFDVHRGFWNLGAGVCRELNYNGIVQKEVDFKTSTMVWTAWSKTFDAGLPFTFHGWMSYFSAKGLDGFGRETAPETVSDMYLMADLSRFVGRKAGAFLLGVGFEYWNNKFGDRNFTAFPGDAPQGPWQALDNQPVAAPMLAAEFHF